jgi:hypothetical protein
MLSDGFGVSLTLYGRAQVVVLSNVMIPAGPTSSKSVWRNLTEVSSANSRVGS